MSLLLVRLRAWYPQVFPVNKFTFEEYQKYTSYTQVLQNMVVSCQETEVKPVTFSILSKLDRIASFDFMPAYRLIDIFLSHDETYASLAQVEPTLLVLYLGIAGTENRKQEDFIIQVLEQQKMVGKYVWLFDVNNALNKYPKLEIKLRSYSYLFCDTKETKQSVCEDI